jgi:hypothetical protein
VVDVASNAGWGIEAVRTIYRRIWPSVESSKIAGDRALGDVHTERAFAAPLERVNFKTASDHARQQINAWVEDQTEKGR